VNSIDPILAPDPARRAIQDVAAMAMRLERAVHLATRGGQRVPDADVLVTLADKASALADELLTCAEAKAREETT
jgi:hypothetical protein